MHNIWLLMGQFVRGYGTCRYPRITAEEVEAEMEEMAAVLEPQLPPPAGLFCCKTFLDEGLM